MANPETPALPAARSYLFVPGDRPERFDKAWASPADEVIIDLEDAVAPQRKTFAREAVAGWLSPARKIWIRVNAADTVWFDDDIALGRMPGVAGLMFPKAEKLPAHLIEWCRDHAIGLLPIVETAAGMQAVEALAETPTVARLAFGALDFQVDLDITGDDDALLYFRSRLVLASRLAGLPAPIDGVTADVRNLDLLRGDAQRSRRLGFGAKLCIHPDQVQAVHTAFSPSDHERDWALRVLAAMESSQGAAVVVDGKMADKPVWMKAVKVGNAPTAETSLRR